MLVPRATQAAPASAPQCRYAVRLLVQLAGPDSKRPLLHSLYALDCGALRRGARLQHRVPPRARPQVNEPAGHRRRELKPVVPGRGCLAVGDIARNSLTVRRGYEILACNLMEG